MITLTTGGTLKGKAGTATAVTYTIYGDSKTTSTNAYQVLGQGQLPSSTGDLLTTTPVPASTSYLIKEIHLANTTGSNVSGIVLYANGTAAGNQITGTITIAANGTAMYDGAWHMYDATGIEQYVGGTGPSGTMAVNSTSTLAPGSSATVANVGTPSAALLNFGIPAGSVWRSNSGVPSNGTGLDGDYYLRTSNGDVYLRASGTYSVVASVLGPTGPTGNAGMLVPCQVMCDGSETYTISAGTVTQINGTTVNGVTPAIGDRILLALAPASTGAGVQYTMTTQPGNGIYTVTANTTNLSVSRATDMATVNKPGGMSVFIEAGTWNPQSLFSVSVPATAAAFTYGTNNIAWIGTGGASANINSLQLASNGTGFWLGMWNGTGNTGLRPTASAGSQTITLPTGASPTLLADSRTISTTAPITGGGDLSANRTLAITAASTTVPGSMSAADKKKLDLHFYDVVSYGADPTGVADSLAAINSAIAAVQAAGYSGGSGGIVWFPAGRYKITATIVITGHNVTLWGAGAGTSVDFGNYYAAMSTHIFTSGAFKAIQVLPVQTLGIAGVPNHGFKLRGIAIDAYSANATIGLQLISCQNFEIDDFYCINATDTALDFNTLPAAALTIAATWPLAAATLTVNSTAASGSGAAFPANTNTAGSVCVSDGTGAARLVTYTGGSATTFTGCSSGGLGSGTTAIGGAVKILPGAQDCTRGKIGIMSVRAVDGGAGSGIGIRMNGDGGGIGNTCLNNFVGPVKMAHLNGIGVKDINSDSNYFDYLAINRAGGGTGLGAEIGAATTAVGASRNNVFGNASFGPGGITCRGTPTAAFASGPTYVNLLQLANGEALPTVETGAVLYWQGNGMLKEGHLGANIVAAQTLTAAVGNIINGCSFPLPPQGWQVGTRLRWHVPMHKTVVGTSWSATIRQHSSLTVGGGTAIATVTYTATGAIDGGALDIELVCVTLGGSATALATFILNHDLAATGLATGVTTPASDAGAAAGYVYTRATMAAFNSAAPSSATTFVFLEINPITAATVMTIDPPAGVICVHAGGP